MWIFIFDLKVQYVVLVKKSELVEKPEQSKVNRLVVFMTE